MVVLGILLRIRQLYSHPLLLSIGIDIEFHDISIENILVEVVNHFSHFIDIEIQK